MATKISITAGTVTVHAELNDSDAAKVILQNLPIETSVQTWGDEIYSSIPVNIAPDNTTTEVDVGTLAYWGPGNAFCIFFGRTPASTSDKPVAAGAVAVCGRVLEDTSPLKTVTDGEKLVIEQI